MYTSTYINYACLCVYRIHKMFQARNVLQLNILITLCVKTLVFSALTVCSTQAIFYSAVQIFHVKTFTVFIKPAKVFTLETFHIYGVCIVVFTQMF